MTHPISESHIVSPVTGPLMPHTDYKDMMRDDFDAHYCSGGDVWTGEAAMSAAPQALMRMLPADRDAHVCDVGAGRGRDTELLLARGYRVTAVDLVASREWEPLSRTWGGRVRFLAADLLDIPGDGEFDAVLDNGCLHHQHPAQYYRYLRRVNELLQPGGLFTVSVFRATQAKGQLYANSGNRLYREFTEAELNELVEHASFALVEALQVPRQLLGLSYLVATYHKTEGA